MKKIKYVKHTVFVYSYCHRIGGLNHECSFFTVLEVGKSKVKEQTDSFPNESSFPVCRQPSSHCIFIWRTEWALVSYYKDVNPMMGVPHHDLITSQRSHFQIPLCWEIRVWTYEFWGDTNTIYNRYKHNLKQLHFIMSTKCSQKYMQAFFKWRTCLIYAKNICQNFHVPQNSLMFQFKIIYFIKCSKQI